MVTIWSLVSCGPHTWRRWLKFAQQKCRQFGLGLSPSAGHSPKAIRWPATRKPRPLLAGEHDRPKVQGLSFLSSCGAESMRGESLTPRTSETGTAPQSGRTKTKGRTQRGRGWP